MTSDLAFGQGADPTRYLVLILAELVVRLLIQDPVAAVADAARARLARARSGRLPVVTGTPEGAGA